MKRTRVNKSGASNQPKWSRHNSCQSNPKTVRFREAVIHKYAVERLDQNHEEIDVLDGLANFNINDDEFDAQTVDTSFSNFSQFSLTSFRGLERHWRKAAGQKVSLEVCAVAAAIAATVEGNSGDGDSSNEKPPRYTESLAALLVMLQNTYKVSDKEDTLTAIYYLLSTVINRVNGQILRDCFDRTVEMFTTSLADYAKSQNVLLLKSCLTCLAEVLRHSNHEVIVKKETGDVINLMLSFIHHSMPKVRKTAYRLLGYLLSSPSPASAADTPTHTTTSHPTARVLLRSVTSQLGDVTSHADVQMRSLNVMKLLMPCLGDKHTKGAIETLLTTCTNSDDGVKIKAFQNLHTYFSTDRAKTMVGANMTAQLLSALDQLRPSFYDQNTTLSWLTVFDVVLSNLAELDIRLYANQFLHFVSFCNSTFFASQLKNSVKLSAHIVGSQFESLPESVKEIWKADLANEDSELCEILKISNIMTEITGFKYSSNWHFLLPMLGKFYSSLSSPSFHPLHSPSLLALCTLRSNGQTSPYLMTSLGVAVRVLGVECLLGVYPLNISGLPSDDLSRSWMIMLLLSNLPHAKRTSLATWQTVFYPVIVNANNTISAADGDVIVAKTMTALVSQIWGLLPGFCSHADDVAKAFKPGFAKHLGEMLVSRHSAIKDVLLALSAMLNSDNAESVSTIAGFGKNYLPQLFNIYLEDGTKNISLGQTILKTIGDFLSKIPPERVTMFFETAKTKLLDENTLIEKKRLLVELVRTMIPFIGSSDISKIFTDIVPIISRDTELKKKIFILLKTLSSEGSLSLVQKYNPQIFEILLSAFESGSPALRKHAFKAIQVSVEKLPANQMHYLNEILPKTIVSLSGRNSLKVVALRALKACSNVFIMKGSLDKPDAVEKLFAEVLSKFEISVNDDFVGTLIALKYLVAMYNDCLSDKMYTKLFTVVSTFLSLDSVGKRGLFTPAFDVLKVMISALRPPELSKYCENIVTNLCDWNRSTKFKWRFIIKSLLLRLCSKCGSDQVLAATPADQRKMVNHLRKQLARVEKIKKRGGSVNDDVTVNDDALSDESDAVTKTKKAGTIQDILMELESNSGSDDGPTTQTGVTGKSRKTRGTNKQSVFISGDDVIDLQDTRSTRFISSTRPKAQYDEKKTSKKRSTDFVTAPDGRIIIEEADDVAMDSDDSDDSASRKKGVSFDTPTGEKDEDGDEPDVKRTRVSAELNYSKSAMGKGASKVNSRQHSADVYKAKKAKGDMRVAGKPQPFAFVPLDTRVLNKRKSRKLEGRLKGLVKASKGGAKSKVTKKR